MQSQHRHTPVCGSETRFDVRHTTPRLRHFTGDAGAFKRRRGIGCNAENKQGQKGNANRNMANAFSTFVSHNMVS